MKLGPEQDIRSALIPELAFQIFNVELFSPIKASSLKMVFPPILSDEPETDILPSIETPEVSLLINPWAP